MNTKAQQDDLAVKFQDLPRVIALGMKGSNLNPSDLESVGNSGLFAAIRSVDLTKRPKQIERYVRKAIENDMKNWIRDTKSDRTRTISLDATFIVPDGENYESGETEETETSLASTLPNPEPSPEELHASQEFTIHLKQEVQKWEQPYRIISKIYLEFGIITNRKLMDALNYASGPDPLKHWSLETTRRYANETQEKLQELRYRLSHVPTKRDKSPRLAAVLVDGKITDPNTLEPRGDWDVYPERRATA